MSEAHRVVVTGIGVVTAAGIGHERVWRDLFEPPAPGHRPIADWDPSPWLAPREIRITDRLTQFAIAAADLATEDAAEPKVPADRRGVLIATALAGMTTFERQATVLFERGERRVSPHFVPMFMPNAPAAAVSIRHALRGPCETTQTACAAATHGLGRAARLVARGECEVMLAGGTEAAITPTVVAGFTNMRALSPHGRLRPFDAERDGFVIAEGAAMFVLERLEGALDRGARIYGEVLGMGSTADGHDITAPEPSGSGAALCMSRALESAGLEPHQIKQINAHGTGTKLNDEAEARAIAAVFGDTGPPVTSTKGVTGHAFGAGGALEAAAVLLSFRHGIIPPTVGLRVLDPKIPLDVVSGAGRAWEPGPAISNSFGFGGHNGSLVLAPVEAR